MSREKGRRGRAGVRLSRRGVELERLRKIERRAVRLLEGIQRLERERGARS